MNLTRVAVAAVAAWVAFLLVGTFVDTVMMDGLSSRRPGLGPDAAVGLVLALLGFLAFAYTYAKGYEGGQGPIEGLRFGVLVALMLVSFAVAWTHVAPVAPSRAVGLALDYIVEFAVYGTLVGAIYKPSSRRAGRGTA